MEASELGLPDYWKVKTLVQLTEPNNISYGIVQPGKHDINGVPIIRVNNFNSIGLDVSDALRVAPEIANKSLKTKLKTDDVLLTLVGSTGLTYIVPEKYEGWNVARAVAVIRTDNTVSADWIKICLDSNFTKYFLDSRANTTVQKTINLSDVKQIPIPVPPQHERDFIEKSIGDLNKKIILNFQTNQTLEQMAQTFFKSWFVEFDPVFDNLLAKANYQLENLPADFPEELHPKAVTRLAALSARIPTQENEDERLASGNECDNAPLPHPGFPSEFEFNEQLGWVPLGWECKQLDDLVEIASSKRVFAKDYVEHGVPFYRGKEITELSQGNKVNTEIFITEDKYQELKLKAGAPKTGDILITSVGTIGNAYLVNEGDKFYFKDGNLTWIKAYKKTVVAHYLITWLKNPVGKNSIENIKIGTTQQAITIKSLNKIKLITPTSKVSELFEEFGKTTYKKIIANNNQNSILSGLRDTLLPKLISGDIKIPEANS